MKIYLLLNFFIVVFAVGLFCPATVLCLALQCLLSFFVFFELLEINSLLGIQSLLETTFGSHGWFVSCVNFGLLFLAASQKMARLRKKSWAVAADQQKIDEFCQSQKVDRPGSWAGPAFL